LAGLFHSGRIVDLILLLVLAEAMLLAWHHHLTGRGPPLRALVPNLLSGAALLVAVRLALVQSEWLWVAAALLLALLAHLADLRQRWRQVG
jgi:multisubunit Na+/H+ antiporter MnhF subunit